MKKLMTLSLVAILATSCNAQDKKEGQLAQNDKVTTPEKPEGTWKVDKEVDENGNIIRYDSIYSWSSGDGMENGVNKNIDSLMQSFRSRFEEHFSSTDDEGIPDIFQNDSLFMKEFFKDDFFGGEMGKGMPNIEEMRMQMDKFRQQFMDRHRPSLVEPENEDDSGSMK